MTVALELPPEIERLLFTEARNKGVPVDKVVRDRLIQQALVGNEPQFLTAEEFDRAFEEIADMIPENIPPVPDEALSRDKIYTREDEWNRQ